MSLHLTDITLTYSDGDARLTALDSVDLHVEKGTMTAVIGPSGSGKSSLLAVAATLTTPDSGRVVVDGTPTVAMTRNELTTLRRNKIGTVFQQPNLLPSLTAVEQLQVIAHLDGHSPAAPKRTRSCCSTLSASAITRTRGRSNSPVGNGNGSISPEP